MWQLVTLSCSTSGEGPTWEETTAEAWRRVIIDKESPTWKEVIHGSLQKKNPEREDSDWDKETHIPVKSQFEDATMAAETCMDTVEESTVDSLPVENVDEASVGLGSQDVVQIHMGNDNLD